MDQTGDKTEMRQHFVVWQSIASFFFTKNCTKNLLFVASHLTFLLSQPPLFGRRAIGNLSRGVFPREIRWIKLFLDSHFGNNFEWFYSKKPLVWKSWDIGWNRWAVLHPWRWGGGLRERLVDLLERRLVIKVGPWIRSGDSPPHGDIWRKNHDQI